MEPFTGDMMERRGVFYGESNWKSWEAPNRVVWKSIRDWEVKMYLKNIGETVKLDDTECYRESYYRKALLDYRVKRILKDFKD